MSTLITYEADLKIRDYAGDTAQTIAEIYDHQECQDIIKEKECPRNRNRSTTKSPSPLPGSPKRPLPGSPKRPSPNSPSSPNYWRKTPPGSRRKTPPAPLERASVQLKTPGAAGTADQALETHSQHQKRNGNATVVFANPEIQQLPGKQTM